MTPSPTQARKTNDDLYNLLIKMQSAQAVITEQLKGVCEDTADLKKVVYKGNGTPAMTTRIDRLEQIAGVAKWLAALLVSANVILTIHAVWDLLAKTPAP